MKRDILRQDDFSGGMNSRDNPKFLPSNECQVLTNAYPGRQAQARQAIQCVHGADFGSQLVPATYGANAFSYIQQFIIVENDRLPLCIARRGTDVLAFRIDSAKHNQNTYPQATGIFTAAYTPNGVTFLPIGSSQILAVGPDLVKPVIIDYSETIIDEVGADLTEVVTNVIVRPANLDVAFVGGAPSLVLLDYSGAPEVFPGGVWYRYAVTLVRRDNVTVDPLLYDDGNYVAGLVESARIADAYIQTAAGATSIDISLTIPDSDDIDDNCTHWRIYRTQGSIAGSGYVSTELEAAGLPLLWIADVPIRGTNYAALYEDTVPDDVLVAEYQYNYDGIIDIPQYIDYAFVAKGRLWVSEKSSLLNRGRWYVSLPPPDATNVTKHLVMFDPTGSYSLDGGDTTVAGWVDTSIDDVDVTRGGAMVGDDAVLWNRNSMWRVRSADPSNGVEAVSLLGCYASRSITVVMDRVYWLSDQGPAMYQGGVVDKIEAFKAKEVWPRNYSSPDGIGELFDGRDPDAIIGAWHNDTWHIAYNPLLRPVVSVTSNWGTTDTPTISAVGTTYPSAALPYWPDEDQFIWCAYHESSNPGIRGAMNIKPSATRLLKDEVEYFFGVDLYDYIYPTPPANSLSPTAWKYGIPCGAWRELESRINTPSDPVFPEQEEQFHFIRTPWSEMVPQHFCVYNGELFYSTGANALDGYSYSIWNYNNINPGFGRNVRNKPVMWSVWGGYLMKIPAKNQAAGIEGADEFPQIFVADKVLEEGSNNWDITSIGNCYPMIDVKTRMMPCSSKLYSYGEALDLRCGTWAHSGLFGANGSGNGSFTKIGTQYNHRTNAQVDWIFVPRLDEDNYAEDSQEGKSPYTGYNVGGISSRDFFQQVIPEGILSPHFAAEVMVPAVPYSDNTPSSVDWLEIGYIPRKNWGPTLVSLSDNQAVE